MAGEIGYRKDLFKETAGYYDRFRPPYPPALLDDLRARVPLGGTARVLDLACGTGQIAFALAADVAEVWAVDQEAEAIEFGTRKTQRLGVTNIQWIAAPAEDVALVEPDSRTRGCSSFRSWRDGASSRSSALSTRRRF